MSLIRDRFTKAKQLVPYIMGGFPDMETSSLVFSTLIQAGCEIVEIGVPYSDPLADGPTIQRAAEAALAGGTTTDSVLKMIGEITKDHEVSPVLMVYYNLIYRYGLERFARAAKEVGVEGVIVPDLTIEESADWKRVAAEYEIDTIFLAAPTSAPERLNKIVDGSTGFVYAVSLTGVTGARTELPSDLAAFIERVKEPTTLPVAVGFGVSQPEQARQIARFADGVIVGSALIDLIDTVPREQLVNEVGAFASGLISNIRSA